MTTIGDGEMQALIEKLLESGEPSIRFNVRVQVLGEDPASAPLCELQRQIPCSARIRTLLAGRGTDDRIPGHPYAKWNGAHWVLAALADLSYPAEDSSLIPLREQVCAWLLSKAHVQSVRVIEGRARRCGSQEGNALYALLSLGLADERADQLAHNLMRWQWPDGGWNCDSKPEALHSSFHETLLPLRALALYGRQSGCPEALEAAERAAEVFLKRGLFRRQRDGQVIHKNFLRLHYPRYWHYDLLFGLKVMAETGFIGDPRCREALDILEEKRLPDGGFPAEAKYYQVTERRAPGRSRVDWGGVSRRSMNAFVTADALAVLKAAGRAG